MSEMDMREIPLDDQGVQDMLMRNRLAQIEENKPSIPPVPQETESKPQETGSPVLKPGEGPTPEMRKKMGLPSEREQDILKQKFGELYVVPLPFTQADGLYKCYIIRQLTRAQWRAMEQQAMKLAESKPDRSADELFEEKIVSLATVWPTISDVMVQAQPAGLISTLFGVIQQRSLFFNPETITALTFTL